MDKMDPDFKALADPHRRHLLEQHYYFGARIESDFAPGSPYVYRSPDGTAMLDGTIVESDPPHRLVMTFRPNWTGEGENTPVSRVTSEITPHEQQSNLTLTHEGLDLDSEIARKVQDGWVQIMSAMKTYLETQRVPIAVGD